MDSQIQKLEDQFKIESSLENAQALISAYSQNGQTKTALEFLVHLPNEMLEILYAQNTNIQTMIMDSLQSTDEEAGGYISIEILAKLPKEIWRTIFKEIYRQNRTYYGFIFVDSDKLDELNLLLQITDLGEDWEAELRDNDIDPETALPTLTPKRDDIAFSETYKFTKNISAEISVLSGGTNYWVSAILFDRGVEVVDLEPGDQVEGDYPFEYRDSRHGPDRIFHLKVIPQPKTNKRYF